MEAVVRGLRERSFAVLPAGALWELLAERGADAADVAALHRLWDACEPQRAEDGTEVYPYKGTLVSYHLLGPEPRRSGRHDHPELGKQWQIEDVDPTTVTTGAAAATH